MDLESLPPELLHRLCTFMTDLDDIRSLRLTSRKFREVADEHLLDEVFTFFETTSLQKVDAIVEGRHSIRKGIKALFLQADGLEHETFEKWDANRRRRAEAFRFRYQIALSHTIGEISPSALKARERCLQPFQLVLLNLPYEPPYSSEQRSKLETFYSNFENAVTSQSMVQERAAIRTTLAGLFRSSPNLSTVQVNAGSSLRMSRAFMHKPFQDTLVIPSENRKLAEHVLIETLSAACDASKAVRRLDVSAVEHTFLSKILFGPDEFQKCLQVFKGVENLHWIFPSRPEQDWDLEFRSTLGLELGRGILANWLQHFQNIRELHLLLPEPHIPQWSAGFTESARTCIWPNLTSLWLGNFLCDTDGMKSLLLRHEATLQSLKLSSVHLIGGSNWPECFESFAGKLSHLQEVKLMGAFTSGGGLDGTEYQYTFDSWKGSSDTAELMQQYILDGGPNGVPVQPKVVTEDDAADAGIFDTSSSDDDVEEEEEEEEDEDIDWDAIDENPYVEDEENDRNDFEEWYQRIKRG